MRLKLRKDNEAPKRAKSNTDNDDANRESPNIAKVDPKRAQILRDSEATK
jgi:hypothetical protein